MLVDTLASPETPEAPAFVEGRVLHAVTGDPIAGAKIQLKLAGSKALGLRYISKYPTFDAGVTDELGRFRAEVAAAYYVPRAEKAGFVAGYGFIPTLMLEPGETRSGLEFQLHEGGVIAGRVLNERGEPISGAEVQVYVESKSRTEPVLRSCDRVYTDPQGNYRVTHLRPARYLVSAKLPELPSDSIFRLFYYPGVTAYQAAEKVEIGPGTVRSAIDFRLRPVSGVAVSGQVTDPGPTFWLLQLHLYPAAETPVLDREQYLIPVERGSGKFAARHIPPGIYRLAAFQQNPQDGNRISGHLTIDVGSSARTGLLLEVNWGARVSGRVQAEDLVPLPPVRVALVPFSRFFSRETVASSDAEGRFTLTNVAAESYQVTVSRLPEGYFVDEVLWSGRDARTSLDLAHSAEGELAITLASGAAKLIGQVTATGQDGLQDRFVLLFDAEGILEAHTRTGAQGDFTLTGIAPGDYRIAVSNRGPFDPLETVAAGAKPITLVRHEVRRLQLGPSEFFP